MSEAVENFEYWANHFAPRDWDYTRNHNIKHIRFTKEGDPYGSFKFRFKAGWDFLTKTKKHGLFYHSSPVGRIRMFFFCLKRDTHQPDGILDSGNIIVYWEETGDYLRYIQPTVGAMLATFLKEEPNHHHAQLIIAEMERLHERVERGG